MSIKGTRNYMLRVNNRNTRTRCEIYSKLMELQNIAFETAVDFIILKIWLKHILMKRKKLIKPFYHG